MKHAINYYQTSFQPEAPFGNNRITGPSTANVEIDGTNHSDIDNDIGGMVGDVIGNFALQFVMDEARLQQALAQLTGMVQCTMAGL